MVSAHGGFGFEFGFEEGWRTRRERRKKKKRGEKQQEQGPRTTHARPPLLAPPLTNPATRPSAVALFPRPHPLHPRAPPVSFFDRVERREPLHQRPSSPPHARAPHPPSKSPKPPRHPPGTCSPSARVRLLGALPMHARAGIGPKRRRRKKARRAGVAGVVVAPSPAAATTAHLSLSLTHPPVKTPPQAREGPPARPPRDARPAAPS